MAFRKTLMERLIGGYRSVRWQRVAAESSQVTAVSPGAARTSFHRDYLTSPERGFIRRFIHRSATVADFLSLPMGDRLRERLRVIDTSVVGDRNRLGAPASFPAPADPAAGDPFHGLSVSDTKKLLRMYQVEKIKVRLKEIPTSSLSHSEFVQICVEGSGNEDRGAEIAKMLDDSGNVIVLGKMVFLRPEQVAKSMEALISQSLHHPNDPRRSELDRLEKQKSKIDQKARAGVRAELYGGLGFLLVQTIGFMRLTFWELSWDVMEPICFFVTSLHFALGYGFFLRTSTEPSFEGYFHRRFAVKQNKLMKIHNFDLERYNELKKIFYPYDYNNNNNNNNLSYGRSSDLEAATSFKVRF